MAATSDDDVPAGETATGRDETPDGDTTAAAAAPATTVPSVAPDDEDEEDRTVQQQLDPKIQNDRSALRAQALALAVRRGSSASPPAAPTPLTPLAQRAPLVPVAPPAQVPPPAPRITSKKATVVGLGSPLPVTRPAAGVEPSSAAPSTAPAPRTDGDPSLDDDSAETIQTEADAEDESITTTAPAPKLAKGPPLPLTVPGTVKIREMSEDDEALDETEVRTLVGSLVQEGPAASSPVPAAGRPSEPPPPNEADETDDSVTTRSPALKNPRLPEDDEPKTSPPVLVPPAIASMKPIPAAGRRPGEKAESFALDGEEGADAYDNDESVTTRGPAVAEYEDDSVTAQGPVARAPAPRTPVALGAQPTLDDGTEGTTKRVSKRAQVPPPAAGVDAGAAAASNDIEEAESITTQAPGHLTNMLRVIATPEDAIDSDDSAENKTAVMLGAPVRPAGAASTGSLRAARPIITGAPATSSGARAAAVVELRESTSDSGLRIAHPEMQSGDHASLGALVSGSPSGELGSGPHGRDVSPAAFANTEQAFNTPARGPQPSLREFDFGSTKKPRYGLLVGLVAVLSFAIPLVLFLWLQQGMMEEAPPRAASEVAPDLVGRADPARPRATKGGAPSLSSASSSAASTNTGNGNRPPWFPRRR